MGRSMGWRERIGLFGTKDQYTGRTKWTFRRAMDGTKNGAKFKKLVQLKELPTKPKRGKLYVLIDKI